MIVCSMTEIIITGTMALTECVGQIPGRIKLMISLLYINIAQIGEVVAGVLVSSCNPKVA